MSATLVQTWLAPSDTWVLSLQPFVSSLVASTSSGSLLAFSPDLSLIDSNTGAHESSINAITKIDDNTLASCATDGVKVWDLRQSLARPVFTFSNPKKSNFLSVGSLGHLLAGGTELAGVDAELHVWDLRNSGSVVRTYVDSHHDDITSISFHPTLPYVMSGSTDGNVIVHNLDEADEDEALHQVVTFSSVHSCRFLSANRILVLSHMETLGFFELNSTDYEANTEPPANELGDLRLKWPECEYVVDLYSDYVAYGANLQQSLSVMPFNVATETFSPERTIRFGSAHGEEVVRDVLCVQSRAYTAGEDGLIKAWLLPEVKEEKEQETKDKKDKREKREKRDKKHKADKKQKKDKKDKRYKPY